MKEKKYTILIPQEGRSDKPLSDPIIRRLREHGFEVIIANVHKNSFGDSYFKVKTLCDHFHPDIFLAIGDRIEMTGSTAAAFHTTPRPLIVHYGAGVTNSPISTYDDINRHCITLWSDIFLCENAESCKTTFDLITTVMKRDLSNRGDTLEEFDIHAVGFTHLDDLEIDESLVPEEAYDLVMYNPTTMYPEVLTIERERKLIIIGPNSDPWLVDHRLDPTYTNLPRPQFLGLLKNCKRFISNSSATYYEAPLWLDPEQIIILGDRNKNRSTKFENNTGASDKIVEILIKWREQHVRN